MSRSVAVPRDAIGTAYFASEYIDDRWDYDDIVYALHLAIHPRFPSMKRARANGGYDECRTIAENEHGRIMVSTYCGLWSVSICPKTGPFAQVWCRKAAGKLNRILKDGGFEPLRCIGQASNGEAFYRPVFDKGPVHAG